MELTDFVCIKLGMSFVVLLALPYEYVWTGMRSQAVIVHRKLADIEFPAVSINYLSAADVNQSMLTVRLALFFLK